MTTLITYFMVHYIALNDLYGKHCFEFVAGRINNFIKLSFE